MVLTAPERSSSSPSASASTTPKRVSLGFLMSLMALCAKHANRVSTKLKTTKTFRTRHHRYLDGDSSRSPRLPPKSPLVRSKQLLSQISNKAITLMHTNNKRRLREDKDIVSPDDFGDGGVWQKAILMGDKCQPLDFSGVIYYDSNGKQMNEMPLRSPRASPSPGYLTRGG